MTRREFVPRLAMAGGIGGLGSTGLATVVDANRTPGEFQKYQEERRQALWGLLGDLPWQHQPDPVKVVSVEKHDGYRLERLVLDLNGVEPVPALLLIPDKRQPKAPGLLYIHWHGGMYDLGKEMLLKGVEVQPPYAPVCAELGLVTLAIDSWCFGERKHEAIGKQGEEDTFKLMLWQGRVLWGMMLFDEFRALEYLMSRPEVDASRVGAFGMSMGSFKTWWLSALAPQIRLAIDLCCLADFQALIDTNGLHWHGFYYYVPSVLKQFTTSGINELIVPRPHLSLNGRRDVLAPWAGVEKIRDELLPLYKKYGRESDCRIELFNCSHEELPEMRALNIEWMKRYLVDARA